MSLSMYQASIPVFIRHFAIFSTILNKGLTNAEGRKIDPSVFTTARLAPDMLPFTKQVQITSDVVKGFAARVAGVEVPSFPDNEVTFADLQERINKTVAFLKSIDAAKIDGSEDRKVSLKIGGQEMTLSAQTYLLNFVLPNFYFHITVAYGILRHNGVDLGKKDFLGEVA